MAEDGPSKRAKKSLEKLQSVERPDLKDNTEAGLPGRPRPEDAAYLAACETEIEGSVTAFSEAGSVYEESDRVPLGEKALDDHNGGWMRIRDIYGPGVTLCDDSFDPQTLAQGSIGDCYLVAAIAAVACVPGFIANLFVSHEVNDAGVYGIRLWNHTTGWWELMWLDDYFPVCKGSFRDLKTDVSYRIQNYTKSDPPKGYGFSPMFMALKGSVPAESSSPAEKVYSFWPMLLEKAIAKLLGSYARIGHGGIPEDVMCLLVPRSTGGSLALEAATFADAATLFWDDIEAFEKSGFFMCASAEALGKDSSAASSAGMGKCGETVMADGIVRTHSYTVIRVVHTKDDSGNQLRLVQLRNPWGENGEWKGAWSDRDTGKWTPAMRAKLRYNPDAAGDADGLFWMPFADFTSVFSRVGLCRYFKAKDDAGGIWYTYSTTCCWQQAVVDRASSRFYPTEFDQLVVVPAEDADLFIVAQVEPEDLRADEVEATADPKELAARSFWGPVKGFLRVIAMQSLGGARLPGDWPTRKQSEDFRIGDGSSGASSGVHIEGRAGTPITIGVGYYGMNATRWRLSVYSEAPLLSRCSAAAAPAGSPARPLSARAPTSGAGAAATTSESAVPLSPIGLLAASQIWSAEYFSAHPDRWEALVVDKAGDWPPETAVPGKFVPPIQHRQFAVRLAHDGYIAVLLEAGSPGSATAARDKSNVALLVTAVDGTATGVTDADKCSATACAAEDRMFELVWPTTPLPSAAAKASAAPAPVTVSHSWRAKAGQWYAVVPWVPYGWCWKGDRTFKLWAAGEKPMPMTGLPETDEAAAASGGVRSAVLEWEALPDAHPVEKEAW